MESPISPFKAIMRTPTRATMTKKMRMNSPAFRPMRDENSPLLGGHRNGKPAEENGLSFWPAVFTIINIFLGLGLLSLPYAFAKGGILAFPGLCVICGIGYVTAMFLKEASATYQEFSYGGLGNATFKRTGLLLCVALVGLEMIGALTMTILFLWDNLSYMISFNYIMLALVASALVTPTVWLLNFSELGFLNSIGVVGNASFTLCVIGICIFNFDTITPMSTSIPPVTDISLSFGILLLCFAGHPCIPGVYKSMRDQSQFPLALKVAFLLMLLIYSLVGFAGSMLYGADTNPILTANLTLSPGGWISAAVTFLIIMRAYVTIASLITICVEVPEEMLLGIFKPSQKKMFRTAVLWFFVFLAYIFRYHIDYVEAVTGSLPCMLSAFICPAVFFLKARQYEISRLRKTSLYVFITICAIIGVAMATTDIINLFS